MRFKVTFYTKYNTSMQTETVEASSQQEAFHMFAVTGCFDIEVTELKDVPHPVDEVKSQHECENCIQGAVPLELIYAGCSCCNGNWQDCPNCKPVEKTPAQKMLDEMKAGTFKLRPYSSYPKRNGAQPLQADEVWSQDDSESY